MTTRIKCLIVLSVLTRLAGMCLSVYFVYLVLVLLNGATHCFYPTQPTAQEVHECGAGERSGKWRTVRDHFLEKNPDCIFCGKPATQVHHVKPFHEYPELELDEDNLVGLCDFHHGDAAHFGYHYKTWNPLIREQAALYRAMVEARVTTKEGDKAYRRRFQQCFDSNTYQNAP